MTSQSQQFRKARIVFGCDLNEDKIKALAEAMVTSGLRDVGYQYMAIDDCWAYKRANDGTILADEKRFLPAGPELPYR